MEGISEHFLKKDTQFGIFDKTKTSGGLFLSPPHSGTQTSQKEEPKDTWGPWGGALFTLEKLATGFVSSLEGAVDYLGSGFAKLIGEDAWAEDIIKNDWFGDWYSHPEEWFNPSEGWKIAGDVAGGIGTSIPALGIGIVTHGAALPTFAAAALPAAGRSTQEAYKKTGELGIQEFGYGLASGTVEGGLETVTNLIGMGTGTLIKSFSKSFAKEAGEAAVKQGLIKTVGKSFIGEAFEEGASEFLDPYIKRATYDGQAENATPDQIIYSGIIGGLSGALMGGGGYGINTANSFIKGHKLTVKGGESEVFQTSDYILGKAQKDALDADIFKEIKETKEKLTLSLKSTGGKVETVAQKKMLGDLSRSNIVGAMNMGVARRALNIVNNAPDIAKRLTELGYKDAEGNSLSYTAEDLTKGYDPKNPSSIYKALKGNAQLRSLAVADAAGQMFLDTSKFTHAALTAQVVASKVDFDRFSRTASPKEIKAVSDALQIDRWQELTYDKFVEKLAAYIEGGGVNTAVKTNELKAKIKEAKPSEVFSDIPKGVFFNNDGVRRYNDGNIDIAISKEGDSYRLYDYQTDSLTDEMPKSEVNNILRSYNNEKLKVFEEAREQIRLIEERQKSLADIETYARDNISDFKKLSAPAQGQIVNIIENGRAKGISDSDVLMYAKVAAHSGIDIQFDKEANYRGVKKDGSADYADGFYEAAKNRIVVNPEGKRTAERLLIHELDHAIRKDYSKRDVEGAVPYVTRIYLDAIEGVDQATRDRITEAYKKTAKPGESVAAIMDETNAYYAEQVLGNKYTLEKLIEAEPTLKEKILNFFKGASTDYADVPKLSGAAKKYYRTYKKLFDEFSARNAQSNATENAHLSTLFAENAQKTTLTNMNQENMQVSDITDASKAKSYTYEALTNKKDIPIVTLSTTIPKTSDGKIDKKAIIAQGKQNARNQNNPNNTDTSTYVHVDDIGVDVLLGAKGLQHGLARSEETAYAVMKIGDILKTSVAVNEMNGSAERNTEMSYVLLGACQDNDNLYVVRSVVSKLSNDVTEIDIYQLGAVKGKKTKTPNSALKRGAAVTEQGSLISSGSSVISISDLIQYVKDIPMINEVLSEDVAKKLGVTRSKGTLSGSLSYALDINNKDGAISPEQAEYFKDSKARDAKGNLKVLYHGTTANFNTFKKGDVGFHFGTKGAARGRVGFGKNVVLKEVYLNITNPIVFDEDLGSWDADYRLTRELYDKGILTQEDAETVLFTDNKQYRRTTEAANKKLASILLEKGYDGIEYPNTFETKKPTTSYIVFNSNQAKEITNKVPTSNPDIRYALDIDSEGENIPASEVLSWFENKPKGDGKIDLEATVARGLPYKRGKSDLTVGELRKVIANSTHEKVYSKKDALRVVNKFSGSSGLTVKAREEIADTIWQFLNEAPDIEYRADMAQDIAEFIVAKILVDSKTENPDAIAAAETLSYLRTGIGKISFTDGDITELHHAVDDKGVKRLVGRWGYKGAHKVAGGEMVSSRRVPMEVYVTEIAREMPGMEHLEEMHPVEAFLEIDRAYERAYADSKDKWISSYWDMPDSEIPSMIAGVRDAILEAYNNEGEKSKFTKLMDEKISRYQKRAEYYKAERDEIKGRDRILGLLMNEATKMKNLKLGTFANATQHESDVLRGSVEKLARIQFRGNLNVTGTRNIIAELRLWYNQKNSMLGYEDPQNPGYYVQGISDMLDALADGEGRFTKADLLMLRDVMAYFNNFVENFGKVYRKGRWVDAEPEAKRYVKTLQENTELKVGILRRALGSRYMQNFGDPMTVARRMDMYESGFYTEMMEELREGAIGAQVAEMEVREEYDRFLNKNRKYIEKAGAEEVVYHGAKIPRLHLIGLYMTLKRKHSRPGLAENGFAFYNLKGKKVRVNGFALDVKDITEAEIDKRAEEQLDIIERLLTDTDREYIKILEKAYNVDARKLKADRDMQRLGFTNAGMGYYYPIRRENIAKNVDSSEYMAEMDRVTSSSFNKNTVRGARQEIFLENADIVFRRHVRAVCQYAYLAPAIEAYNTLYNMDVSGNPNHPISVATEGDNVWDRGNKYFVKLISDIQGIPAVSGEGSEILSRIRGGYAKFQLGANPKVWFTQGSSLFASTSLIDTDSLIKGATISAEGMDKYCSLAKLRNSENTAAIAQAVLDTRAKKAGNAIDRVSDALMAPIGKMDRFVVSRLFGAAQAQVEKNGGGKVGTEENRIAAGKLLEKVLLETQQNSIATERSAAMRSGNEILRTVTMFTADSMKVVGRAIDGFGEVLTLRERIRRADGEAKAALEKRLKSAEKKTKKALGAMVTSAIYMACVAQLFRWLYDKEDDDKSTLEVMTADVAGNLIGGLPLVSDVISRLFLGGYELDNYAYSTFNDLVDSASKLIDVSKGIFTGEMGAEERNRALRDTAYALGQLNGIPFRNVYNALFGLTKRFSPTVAFQVDSLFYEKNYQTELNRAIESGDNEMSSFILSLMLGERVSGDIPGGVFNEILALTKNGQKVLPRVMPDKVTIGGVEYTLTEGEREAMREIYSGADSALERLFANSGYKALDNSARAELIDHVYDSYYALASSSVLGTNGGNRAVAMKAVSADTLALLYAKTKNIESDKDREGKTIAGSKRAKVVKAIGELGVSAEERLLLICASGYSLKDGDIRGLSAERAKTRLLRYILNLKGVSAIEKAEIAEMCGFEVKNGRIVRNSAGLPKLKTK